MRKIAITLPEFFDGEGEAITKLLTEGGYERVHIRKPGASVKEVKSLVKNIPENLYTLLSFHDHFNLAMEIGIGGIHLNSRNNTIPTGWNGLVSRSLHSMEEIADQGYDYAFLSPIFPSISKPGYKGNFNSEDLRSSVNERIFALGGVTPRRFGEIEQLGFGGAAMLGYAWKRNLDMKAFQLQFITHPVREMSITEEVEKVLSGGCRWVQLRHKDADEPTLLEEGREIRRLCDRYGAVFIIDDHVELVKELNADGVHLGKNDMPLAEARRRLGMRRIIGATANCVVDIERAAAEGADYIGLGPYRFTTTKEKLSPVLGIEGYRDILSECGCRNIELPIVAIGGITAQDISALMQTGVNGVAISGSIIKSVNPVWTTMEIISEIRK